MELGPLLTIFVYLFVAYIIGKLIFEVIMGSKLGEIIGMARRQKPFRDVDATDHATLMRELDSSARRSIPVFMRGGRVFLEPDDTTFYVTSPGGRHNLGKLWGMVHLDFCTYIVYRPAWRMRKERLFVPPFMVKSSLGAKNVMVEGVGTKEFGLDYYHPVPSPTSEWTMEMMMDWVRRVYHVLIDHHTDFLQKDQGAYMVRKAGSDPTTFRMAQQGISSVKEAAAQTSEEDGP